MGLYYLQSRYYDPELCRFLNADAYVSTGQGELGNNMFAYCLNNPVAYVDVLGTISTVFIAPNSGTSVLPWHSLGPGARGRIPSTKEVQGHTPKSKKQIDITEKLNEAMIRHAEELSSYAKTYGGMAAAIYFAEMVRSGGKWDLKAQKEWGLGPGIKYIYGSKELEYDDVGNIHYGFVGRVLFTEDILLVAGGIVQIYSGTSSWAFYDSYFDDPRDQIAISYGYHLWEAELP